MNLIESEWTWKKEARSNVHQWIQQSFNLPNLKFVIYDTSLYAFLQSITSTPLIHLRKNVINHD